MKTLNVLIVIFLFSFSGIFAQHKKIDAYFKLMPADIQKPKPEIQEYNVSLKWQNLDALTGNKLNCNLVNGIYKVGLNDSVYWKDVSLAQIRDFNQQKVISNPLPAFDSLAYKSMDTAFLSERFYNKIPAKQRDLAKWLVSDAVQMQGLATYVFDSLEFKKEFIPKMLENYNVKFEDWVNFTSRYQKLIWSGITLCNSEVCAIIKFESYYNPIEINNDQMQMKGRSLYYGEMWISLTDKQIEYSVMMEDNVIKLKSSMFPQEQLIDLQREIVFSKRN